MAPPPPPRWINCPRKSLELIGGKFLAFKTPLDGRYDSQLPPESLFHPSMLFSSMKSYKVKVGLWIDLTNTKRFYDKKLVEDHDCKYTKLQCRGHGETPSKEQTDAFINICKNFINRNPLEIIAVHCTHGFNRTGFLISAFLCETEDWSADAAVSVFAKARPPGIYKYEYIEEVFKRYNGGDVSEAPAAPDLPDWCYDNETGVDEDGNPTGEDNDNKDKNGDNNDNGDSSTGGGGGSRRRELKKKDAKFMEGVPGVKLVFEQPKLGEIQRVVQKMCHWRSGGFPGCQPVSMGRENIQMLSQKPYKVSWKADGTRYMMLINGKNEIYFLDRDNSVFQVENLTFLHRKDPNKHLSQTLIDGEMVIDEVGNQHFPRYLIYDIIMFEGCEVGKTEFDRRCLCIKKEIIDTRGMYIQQGKIDKTKEPFSVRQKQFWDVTQTATLLGPKFTKATLGHEPDGLIFQPAGKEDLYNPGRDDTVLKWKPLSHNSVDFKLKIVKVHNVGMLPESVGCLHVGGLNTPFSQIKVTKALRPYDNKIIECKWENNQWVFMRERTDKSYPNAYTTAENVVRTIKEPLTTDMLLQFIQTHRFRQQEAHAMPPPNKQQRLQ